MNGNEQGNIILSLNSISFPVTNTWKSNVENKSVEPALAQSLAQGTPHPWDQTTTSPFFPPAQKKPGGTRPQSFSVWLFLAQSPQGGFLTHQK